MGLVRAEKVLRAGRQAPSSLREEGRTAVGGDAVRICYAIEKKNENKKKPKYICKNGCIDLDIDLKDFGSKETTATVFQKIREKHPGWTVQGFAPKGV